MNPLSRLPPPPADLVQHSTWTSMHATAVHVLPGMLRYLGVAEDDIDDLSQEVLLGAYTSLLRYNPAYPASAPGSASLPPAASPLLQHFASAVPAAAEDAAQEQQEQDDPASLPRPASRDPSRPSRPHGLGPRWRVESSWLFGIAWRKVRRHLERTYRRLEVPMGLSDEACFQGADVAPSSEQRIATNQRIAIATRLLATIAPERRAILIMADMVEIPLREIARSLELNENTASSRLRLAREDFRSAVKRLRPEEQRSLRSGLLMVPLFSLASSRSAVASPAVHSGASAIVETSAPAARLDLPSDLGRQDLADRPGRVAHLARLLARFVRPALARFILPALAWATAGVGGAVLFAALAPALRGGGRVGSETGRAPVRMWKDRMDVMRSRTSVDAASLLRERCAHSERGGKHGVQLEAEGERDRAVRRAPDGARVGMRLVLHLRHSGAGERGCWIPDRIGRGGRSLQSRRRRRSRRSRQRIVRADGRVFTHQQMHRDV